MGSKGGKVPMVRTQTDRMLLFLLIAGLGSIALAQENALDKNVKEAQNLVIKLSQKSDIDIKKSYRCGMFFPDPKDPNGLPSAPLLIFNSSWAAEECPDIPDYGKYNNFCNEIFRKFTTTLTLNDPSLKTRKRAAPLEMISASMSRRMSRHPSLEGEKVRSFRRDFRLECFPMLVVPTSGPTQERSIQRSFAA